MTDSKYQVAIYEEVGTLCGKEKGALAVNAVAGSGKTTTSVRALNKVPPTMNCGFFAFNKSIAEELGRRVPMNVVTKTLNGFGNQIVRKSFSMCPPKLNQFKTMDICRRLLGNDAKYMGGTICKVIALLKGSGYCGEGTDVDVVRQLMDHHDLEYSGNIQKMYSAINDIWRESLRLVEREIDFDDQLFVPIYYNMPVPKFDFLMVDEAQDLNEVQMSLVLKAADRMMIVGDKRQAIYGFRGADPEAMNLFIDLLHAKELPLSICYRCAKNVVREAQRIVPEIEFSETAPDGVADNIKAARFREVVRPDDFVLCRTTAPLVSSCLKFIREGKKATVRGRDIGVNLTKMVDKVSGGEDSMDTESFGQAVNMFRREEITRLERANRESKIQTVEDQCDTLMVFVETCENVMQIKNRISEIFSDNSVGISHMTKHRSKGLETDRVFTLRSDPVRAKKKWMQIQEANLQYVGVTRAKKELYYVND